MNKNHSFYTIYAKENYFNICREVINNMNRLAGYLSLFIIGGFAYCLLEISVRGYSHISMFVAGGMCFVLVGGISKSLRERMPLVVRMMIGALIITLIELITGIIVNVWMGLNVWDYTGQRMNYMGQVCLLFSLIWFLITLPIIGVYNIIEDFISNHF